MNGDAALSTRTFAGEDDLPRVPLPDVADSCSRFLHWCRPLLSDEQMADTEEAVAEFLHPDGAGRRLQAELERYEATEGVPSWLERFWAARYLGRRDRIALNANFFFLFADTPAGQDERAAALIAAAVEYKQRLDAETLPPVTVRGVAQSMVAHKYLFSATRIPDPVQDTLRSPYSQAWPGPSTARHIVVFRAGRMIALDVIDPSGRAYTAAELAGALRGLASGADAATEPGVPVGPLTTMARARWADARARLLAAHPANAQSLDTVETALFCLCLADDEPADVRGACDVLLAGDPADRWFDKALTFIVFPSGRAGLNVEHCKLDGTTILAFVDAILPAAAARTGAGDGQARPEAVPESTEIVFTLDEALRVEAQAAAADFTGFAAAAASTLVTFDDFGAERVKKLNMSPDAFVQMAYQLAHRRARGVTGPTYESIATRAWRHGRTEAMRVVSEEILDFVAAMDDPDADEPTRRAAFRAAADNHVTRARICQRGEAPEQHLWELEFIAGRAGADLGVEQVPALYSSPGWLTMREDALSTSSAPSTNITYFGFGSTGAGCIGVAYVLLPDRFHLYLSTPRAAADQMERFAAELRRAVAELDDLVTTG